MRILVVDDTPSDLMLMTDILGFHGYDAVGVSSVAKAVRVLQEDASIALIILDLMMPKEDGFAFLQFKRRHAKLDNIPVIVCSAAGSTESVLQTTKAGAVDFLVKPVTSEVVGAKILSVLSRINVRGCVLVADTEQIFINLIGEIIRRAGYRCISAHTGQEVLDIVEKESVDLIIANNLLPDIAGKALTSAIHKCIPNVPIIFTGDTQNLSPAGARSQGAVDVIFKPTTNLDILNKLTKYLSPEAQQSRPLTSVSQQ